LSKIAFSSSPAVSPVTVTPEPAISTVINMP
jgi:hypothetical protein